FTSSLLRIRPRLRSTLFPYTTLFRSCFSGAAPLMAATKARFEELSGGRIVEGYSLTEAMMACIVNPLEGTNKIGSVGIPLPDVEDRKSTRLNSSHVKISYAVFCLKKK